ncbi:hypothetical protein UFOVP117_301 [uncultured Caudovirales phage]|jgi:hypothetical protein|uniref:Uncharacterized protein n=1 Tax=uncultured Caudovirales phage TaxID=2100421 RepID=A0A6J5L9V3_9CAUD|nr:hypothetical protein UFOVP117_301 [uncultured Caudovirales phage]
MKNLFLSLVLVMVGLVANSQVITVTVTTDQKFNHSADISTIQAMELDAIEYPYYTVGNNVFIFDLNKRTMSLNGGKTLIISKINKSENTLDCIVLDNGASVLFVMGETSNGQNQFLAEWFSGDKITGYFSMNSDFSYVIK